MTGERLKVFLDTNVLFAALQRRRSASTLFEPESQRAASYVIDSVVLQELLLAAQATSGGLDGIIKHVHVLDAEPFTPL